MLVQGQTNELLSDVRNRVVCHNNLFYKITGQSFLYFYSKDRFSALLAPNGSEKKRFEQERRGRKKKRQDRNKTALSGFHFVKTLVIKPKNATQRGALDYHIIPSAKLLTDVSS